MKHVHSVLNRVLHALLVHVLEGQLRQLRVVERLALQDMAELHPLHVVLDHVDHRLDAVVVWRVL